MSTPAVASRAAAPRAMAARAAALWRFSRPHTIAGTTVSVLALYAIAGELAAVAPPADLAATMIAAWSVNVAIVGLNQIEDVEIDRINKPALPLAAGELSIPAAKAVVALAFIAPITMALSQSAVESVAVISALAVGAAYSSPPLRLKRFPVVAMISISGVRSLAVNLGVYCHFAGSLDEVPAVVWALTAFVAPFAAAIALLKDVPDIRGDARFSIRTFSIAFGPPRVLAAALCLLALAYLGMAVPAAITLPDINRAVFAGGHLAALVVLVTLAVRTDPEDAPRFSRFYMRVWALFFFEYVLVAVAVVISG